ncbi:hypothetical protein IMG5_171410 [Ichthyophthirius multifiliis]|uniref:Transmembrane protein n=1 Tax=Ichthyophthirius multifiliis TaxID=5932 RepID=G0R1M0_ICHMU|nr:hypothetical protein IMG5_171410 [Ichthyophthirius multifiliis]EGR28630.1 hypothetical protein IMG5_171410 [Ichthyophthirius multifiliis]|eukprot:XP_004029866.1 hypothetical protein IMG5_171410 [Ichthyophthirius multifiliis]
MLFPKKCQMLKIHFISPKINVLIQKKREILNFRLILVFFLDIHLCDLNIKYCNLYHIHLQEYSEKAKTQKKAKQYYFLHFKQLIFVQFCSYIYLIQLKKSTYGQKNPRNNQQVQVHFHNLIKEVFFSIILRTIIPYRHKKETNCNYFQECFNIQITSITDVQFLEYQIKQQKPKYLNFIAFQRIIYYNSQIKNHSGFLIKSNLVKIQKPNSLYNFLFFMKDRIYYIYIYINEKPQIFLKFKVQKLYFFNLYLINFPLILFLLSTYQFSLLNLYNLLFLAFIYQLFLYLGAFLFNEFFKLSLFIGVFIIYFLPVNLFLVVNYLIISFLLLIRLLMQRRYLLYWFSLSLIN